MGEFTYYDDPDDPTMFGTRNVLYHYGPDRLVIGKLRALGEGVGFIMNGANHPMDGPSTFPFPIMGGSWAEHFDLITDLPGRAYRYVSAVDQWDGDDRGHFLNARVVWRITEAKQRTAEVDTACRVQAHSLSRRVTIAARSPRAATGRWHPGLVGEPYRLPASVWR